MNRVINIRLGHYVLTMDEEAAFIADKYTAALKLKYETESSASEIVSDIEERMGELLEKKQREHHRNYNTVEDVEMVIAQIGPLDSTEEDNSFSGDANLKRRLFRDPDNKILGGVWAGIGAYFDTDPVLFRIGWVISVMAFGFGIPLYIILWVVIPEARTAADKLIMKGQRPTLKNFENNVKNEFQNVGRRFGHQPTRDRFTHFLKTLVQYAAVFLGLLIKFIFSVVGITVLVLLITVLIGISSDSIYVHSYSLVLNGQEGLNTVLSAAGDPFWIKMVVLVFLLLLISWIGLLVFTNMENMKRTRIPRRYIGWASMLCFLIIFVFAFDGIRSVMYRTENKAYREYIQVSGDTLLLNSEMTDTDKKGLYALNTFENILPSVDNKFYIEQHNVSFGHNRIRGTSRNQQMHRMFNIDDNVLTIMQGKKIGNLKNGGMGWVKYTLHVPVGKTVKTGENFHFSENNYTSLTGKNASYTMDSSGYMLGESADAAYLPLSSEIKSVKIGGKFDVQIIPSSVNKIELVSGPVLGNRHWIETHGNELVIEENHGWLETRLSYIKIYIKQLERIEIEGISKLNLRNWKAHRMELLASGDSRVEGILDASKVEIDCGGSAQCTLQGSCNELFANTSGAAEFYGENFRTLTSHIDCSGASKITIWATKELDGEASGASVILLKGSPQNSRIETSGASRFRKI